MEAIKAEEDIKKMVAKRSEWEGKSKYEKRWERNKTTRIRKKRKRTPKKKKKEEKLEIKKRKSNTNKKISLMVLKIFLFSVSFF